MTAQKKNMHNTAKAVSAASLGAASLLVGAGLMLGASLAGAGDQHATGQKSQESSLKGPQSIEAAGDHLRASETAFSPISKYSYDKLDSQCITDLSAAPEVKGTDPTETARYSSALEQVEEIAKKDLEYLVKDCSPMPVLKDRKYAYDYVFDKFVQLLTNTIKQALPMMDSATIFEMNNKIAALAAKPQFERYSQEFKKVQRELATARLRGGRKVAPRAKVNDELKQKAATFAAAAEKMVLQNTAAFSKLTERIRSDFEHFRDTIAARQFGDGVAADPDMKKAADAYYMYYLLDGLLNKDHQFASLSIAYSGSLLQDALGIQFNPEAHICQGTQISGQEDLERGLFAESHARLTAVSERLVAAVLAGHIIDHLKSTPLPSSFMESVDSMDKKLQSYYGDRDLMAINTNDAFMQFSAHIFKQVPAIFNDSDCVKACFDSLDYLDRAGQ